MMAPSFIPLSALSQDEILSFWQFILIVVMPGLFGGLVNSWLVYGYLYLPRRMTHSDGRKFLDMACLGNAITGVVGGFLAYAFAAPEQIANHRTLAGLCLLFGLGGGNVIVSLLQQHNLLEKRTIEKDRTEAQNVVNDKMISVISSLLENTGNSKSKESR